MKYSLNEGQNVSILKIENLTKSFRNGFGRIVIFENANLEVKEGDFVVILAPSGYGKSTLLNIIAGLEDIDEGRVIVAEREINRMRESELAMFRRKYIGIVFQFFNLIPTLTTIENVMLPLELAGVPTKQARERAIELLTQVGLRDKMYAFPSVLSGGEQQRIAIARALSNNPKLILADEPTGNLDEKNAENVFKLLRKLNDEIGITVLVATHDVSLATKFAKSVVRISNKKLILESNGGNIFVAETAI
ncbi:MAG: ABC transporter ATP-binding protein [Candidatus Odinarchaeota archaeon]|nr:ABC transporter ATP-binding protein [Candidatus Odinarchaeota archaeon]